MLKKPLLAIILIASCAVSMGAGKQKVYRCGNSYSQTPCTGEDAPDAAAGSAAARPLGSEAENKRQMAVAQAMEKQRLAQEAQVQKARDAQIKAIQADNARAASNARATPGAAAATQSTVLGASKTSKNKAGPEFFTAKGAASAKP